MGKLFNNKDGNPEKRLKIAINMKPVNSPWGGISPFISQLSGYLKKRGHTVTYRLEQGVSCILMVKSYPTETATFDIGQIRQFKKKNLDVPCIQRINECDIRKGTDYVDELLRSANEAADYTIFISDWLKEYFIKRWFNRKLPNQVILNGADPEIFYPKEKPDNTSEKKLRIVTHHWSCNWMKGFKVYQEVDRLINDGELEGFSLMVIGNWPKEINWRSAQTHPAVKGKRLAELLRWNHLYLTASLWEPCGMHHIEGAQCGLPLVYHEDGGGIVEFGKKYGIGFREDIKQALLKAREEYSSLRKKVLEFMPSGERMCSQYESVLVSAGVNKRND